MINVNPHPELRPKYTSLAYAAVSVLGLLATGALMVSLLFRK